MEPSSERQEFEMKKVGRGSANHKSNLRLFDAPDGFTPAVTLYRDSAGWCPYCEKVWLQLEEKRIPYAVVKNPLSCYGDKSSEFFRVSPSGQMPVAKINGRVVSESNAIMRILEEEFPEHKPLLPPSDSPEAARVGPLLRLERKVFSSWFSWLTSRAGSSSGAADEMHALLLQVDAALAEVKGQGPYFLGAEISMVDVMFAPFLERMAASLPYYKGFETRSSAYPHLLGWYRAMDARPAYAGIKSDYYTHVHDLPPQLGGCPPDPSSAAAAAFRAEIDGGAWDVSVGAESCLEPMLPASAAEARRDCARQVLDNYENIVKFACRGAGTAGAPRVRAELADPRAQPKLAVVPAVDFALRLTLHQLLLGAGAEAGAGAGAASDDGAAAAASTSTSGASAELWAQVRAQAGPGLAQDVANSLAYLRDRVGVPRDMTVHGARQLRAHLNQAIAAVSG